MIADQAAPPHQARGRQALRPDHDPGAQDEDARAAVGLARDRRPDLVEGLADAQAVADGDPEPGQQALPDRGAEAAVALVQGGAKRQRRRQLDGTVERVAAVDRLELDQGAVRRPGDPRHGPHLDRVRDPARGAEPGPLLGRGRAVAQAQMHVAAQQAAGVLPEPGGQALRERAHAGDRRHAQGEAGEEDAKALEAAAQLAAGETKGQGEVPHRRCFRRPRARTPRRPDPRRRCARPSYGRCGRNGRRARRRG